MSAGAPTLEQYLRPIVGDVVRAVVREELRAALGDQRTADMATEATTGAPPYLTVADAATRAAVTPKTLRRWIEGGDLEASRIGRAYRIDPAELERFLKRAAAHDPSLPDATAIAQQILSHRRRKS